MVEGLSGIDASTPAGAMDAMQEVERKLANLEVPWAQAASLARTLDGHVELRRAQLTFALRGTGTVEQIKAQVLDALWKERDGDLMAQFTQAEADVVAYQAAFKTLDRLLSSLQSRLAAMARMETHRTSGEQR